LPLHIEVRVTSISGGFVHGLALAWLSHLN
jgi:hypothetical protein